MAFTALERLLATERVRQRAARQGGFSLPALGERAAAPTDGPFFVTNMRGTFLPTRPSREGIVRYGFSPVPVGQDDLLLVELNRVLSSRPNWSGRCTNVQEAIHRLQANGMEPHAIVASPKLLVEITPGLDVSLDDAWAAMRARSEVAVVSGVTVLLANLPERAGFVAAMPALVGSYVRTGDHLGVVLQRADQALMVVT